MSFSTTDYALGASLVSNTKLTAEYSGLYNIQFSVQLTNTTNDVQTVSIWFSKNGTNVANSNSEFGIKARKSSGAASQAIAALNFFIALQKDDYVELVWRPSDIGVSIEHFATQSSPTRPATPSIIATMSYLSSNGYTSNLFTMPYISAVTKEGVIEKMGTIPNMVDFSMNRNSLDQQIYRSTYSKYSSAYSGSDIVPGRTINVVYTKTPTALSNANDVFTTVTGLEETSRDLIIYGAAYWADKVKW